MVVVLDGRVSEEYLVIHGGISLSPDGRLVARTVTSRRHGEGRLIVDGVAAPDAGAPESSGVRSYQRSAPTPAAAVPGSQGQCYGATFSADWRSLACLGWVRNDFFPFWGPRFHEALAVDGCTVGRHTRVFERSFVFSPDGRRFAYVAASGSGWVLVTDGVSSPRYHQIPVADVTFSPDGGRLAFLARNGNRWFVVADGSRHGPYRSAVLGSLRFSPDSRHLAYAVSQGEGQVLVADGHPQAEWSEVSPESISFSPDGRHLAYAARRGRDWTVIVDGIENGTYDDVPCGAGGRIRFLDGGRLEYPAIRANRLLLVEAAVPGP